MGRPFVVGVTGASGICYAVKLLRALTDAGEQVALVISDAAKLVFQEELGAHPKSYSDAQQFEDFLGVENKGLIQIYSAKDFTAPIASGSYPVKGMVIVPCSMGTLGALASGVSQNLIHRAADCVLKESRPLILVPRETPLNVIHLENLLKLSRAGAKIVPAMPGFYSGAKSLEEIVDFMVGKILDQMGVEHVLYPRWTGMTKPVSVAGRGAASQ